MSTDIDWGQELDASFGARGDRPPTDYLPAAHKALRRRRTAMGAAALASVLVVGGIGWAMSPGPEAPRTGEAATEAPSPTPDAEPAPPASKPRPEKVNFLGNPATYDSAGKLRVAPGWTVVETIDNPMGYTRPGRTSVGLRAVRDGVEEFVLLAGDRDGVSIHNNDAAGSLSDWLPTVVANQRVLDQANDALRKREPFEPVEPFRQVQMTADGDLTMPPGASLVEVRAAADLPPALTSQGDKPVAAQVATADGRPLWVFARLVEGRPQVDEFATRHPDLDAFVTWAAAQFESGGGLR